MKNHFITTIIVFLFANTLFNLHAEDSIWQSELVRVDKSGKLHYSKDAKGNQLPDFSSAGYGGGGIELPYVPVEKTISALKGDNTLHIQKAIDEVGALALRQGKPATLLLKAGLYEIKGSIHINHAGVVVRGEGDGVDPAHSTILFSTDSTSSKRTLVYIGNSKAKNSWYYKAGKKITITDEYVPVGTTTIRLSDTHLLNKGDQIIIQHDDTEPWLRAIGGGVGKSGAEPWTLADNLHILYNRYIVAVNHRKKTITLDAPVFYALDKSLSASYVYKMDPASYITNVGMENLRLDCYYNPTITLTDKKYGHYTSDEQHAWTGVKMIAVENGWLKNVTVKGFSGSGVLLTQSSRITVKECKVIDPVSRIHGGRRYGFNTADYCQLVLFVDCYARNSRHGFISNGTSTASGNVFLRCSSESAYASSEGHRKWSNGFLFDNYKEINYNNSTSYTLAFLNRGTYGTSHGWAMVTGVAWNCDLTAGNPDKGHLIIQRPPTGQNYAIGCNAAKVDGNGPFDGEPGYIEGTNRTGLYPESLYEAQLAHRIKSGKEGNIHPNRIKKAISIL